MGPISTTDRKTDENAASVVAHTNILLCFPELVSELGGDATSLLEQVGATPSLLQGLTTAADCRLAINLLEHAASALHCPAFGLRLAALQGDHNILGLMGVVLRNATTFGDALGYANTHPHAHNLATALRVERRNGGDDVFVGADILLEGLPNKTQAIEHAMLTTHLNAARNTGGRARARCVVFRHPALSPLSIYRLYFHCEVLFNQYEDGVLFSGRDLRAPIIDADLMAYEAAATQIDATFPRNSPPIHAQVRGVILHCLGTEFCTIEQAAAELHLHPRTLRRRLKAEGKAFLAIKDAVRRDVASYYLRHTNLDFTLIARKLGYAEPSVLTRSCARWFSASPTQLRRQGNSELADKPLGGPA